MDNSIVFSSSIATKVEMIRLLVSGVVGREVNADEALNYTLVNALTPVTVTSTDVAVETSKVEVARRPQYTLPRGRASDLWKHLDFDALCDGETHTLYVGRDIPKNTSKHDYYRLFCGAIRSYSYSRGWWPSVRRGKGNRVHVTVLHHR